ncbi:MAG: protease inhibitor I42 family protein [Sulfuricella sp.]|nr:protease inhibitor I42 family protein [Sulfuricella sp.]
MNRWTWLMLCCAALPVAAETPSFDAATGRLTLPEVLIGDQSYSNGVLLLSADGRYSVLSLTPGVTVSDTDNGRALELAMGQILTVKLKANPTTGYDWQFNDQSISVLSRQGDAAYVADSTTLIGSGGVKSWKFKAVVAGSGTLRFEYLRSWETGVAPIQVVQFPVTVK